MDNNDNYTDDLMKRCQTEGYDLAGAKLLLAECYGHIGWLSNELHKAQGVIKLTTMQKEIKTLQTNTVAPQRLVVPHDKYRELARLGELSLPAIFKSLDKSQKNIVLVDETSNDETLCSFAFEEMGFGVGDGVLHITKEEQP